MKSTRHRLIVVSLAVMLVLVSGLSLVAASYSFASRDSNGFHFESSLVGSTPGVTIGGVGSGGAPWVVMASNAGIDPNGMLHLSVVGLVISLPGSPVDGTTGPVKNVLASLVCGNSVVASTSPVPLGANGDARINQKVSLPSTCFGPVILVRISGLVASDPWIAATGFASQ